MIKKTRDAEVTKANIIKNAMILFSKNGYDATTIDDIAKVCYVNKALVYYYFKNKAGLYEKIMSDVLSAIHEKVLSSNKCCDNPLGELKAFIDTYSDFAVKQPYFPALLLRELSDSGAHLPEMMFTNMRKLFALLSDILQRGKKEGIFRSSLPMVIYFMIIGTINLLVTTTPLRKKATLMTDKIDTCSECPMDEISSYIFKQIKLILEVKNDEKNISCT